MNQLFATVPNSAGEYLVIANDTGHEVAVRDTLQSANGVAQNLNRAADKGRAELIKALGGLR